MGFMAYNTAYFIQMDLGKCVNNIILNNNAYYMPDSPNAYHVVLHLIPPKSY